MCATSDPWDGWPTFTARELKELSDPRKSLHLQFGIDKFTNKLASEVIDDINDNDIPVLNDVERAQRSDVGVSDKSDDGMSGRSDSDSDWSDLSDIEMSESSAADFTRLSCTDTTHCCDSCPPLDMAESTGTQEPLDVGMSDTSDDGMSERSDSDSDRSDLSDIEMSELSAADFARLNNTDMNQSCDIIPPLDMAQSTDTQQPLDIAPRSDAICPPNKPFSLNNIHSADTISWVETTDCLDTTYYLDTTNSQHTTYEVETLYQVDTTYYWVDTSDSPSPEVFFHWISLYTKINSRITSVSSWEYEKNSQPSHLFDNTTTLIEYDLSEPKMSVLDSEASTLISPSNHADLEHDRAQFTAKVHNMIKLNEQINERNLEPLKGLIHRPTFPTIQPTPGERVFAIPELLEMILLERAYSAVAEELEKREECFRELEPMRTITRIRRVNRATNRTIIGSRKLQRLILYEDPHFVPPVAPLVWLLTKLGVHMRQEKFFDPDSYVYDPMGSSTINTLLKTEIQIDVRRKGAHSHRARLRAFGLLSGARASWRKLTVTQSDETEKRVTLRCVSYRRPAYHEGITYYEERVDWANGITLGDVLRDYAKAVGRSGYENAKATRSSYGRHWERVGRPWSYID